MHTSLAERMHGYGMSDRHAKDGRLTSEREIVQVWKEKNKLRLQPFLRPKDIFFMEKDSQHKRIEKVQEAVDGLGDGGLLVFRRSARICLPGCDLVRLEKAGLAPTGISDKVNEWWRSRYQWARARRHEDEPRQGSYFEHGEFAIAALMRLGGKQDVLRWHRKRHERGELDEKWLTSSYFLGVLSPLREEFPEAKIILFTDGPAAHPELIPLRQAGFHVHVCDNRFPDLFYVFHSLVTADVLVCGSSGFSVLAGIIGDNAYIQPVRHNIAVEGAVRADNKTGEFDMAALKERLCK
jgi:hypothetical protein